MHLQPANTVGYPSGSHGSERTLEASVRIGLKLTIALVLPLIALTMFLGFAFLNRSQDLLPRAASYAYFDWQIVPGRHHLVEGALGRAPAGDR